ncbi:MAG TPA: ester cyclase [Dehalococcoidia bacterium]|nr:ester cyclase [Dehalococcoidia bacterium]
MDIKVFARKFIEAEDEAWKNRNFNPLEALETPDVAYHIPPVQESKGWEAHKQYIQIARQAVSDLHQEWEYVTGDGNVFSLLYKARGLFTGEIPGMPPPTGKEVTSDYLFVFQLENGKIAEAWARGSATGYDL